MDPITFLISGGAILGTALAAALSSGYTLSKLTTIVCGAATIKEMMDELGDDDMFKIEGGGRVAWLSEKDMARLWKIEKRDGEEAMQEEFYRIADNQDPDDYE